MKVAARFRVEPYREGSLGPHVSAAVDAVESTGLEADVGPFGTTVTGELSDTVVALAAAIEAAMSAGASRVTLDVTLSS